MAGRKREGNGKGIDVTVEVLREIRDAVGQTNVRLEAVGRDLGQRIDETNRRVDETNKRIVESELRTATALTDLAGTIREMTSLLRAQHDMRPRLEKCEQEIVALKHRLG